MIPCRLFLHKCMVSPQHQSIKNLKIVLTLNTIFYDEIQPFQSKYFCLTSQDVIGIQVNTQQNDLFIGCTTIKSPFNLALESQQIQLKFKSSHKINNITEIALTFSIEPVAQFKKRNLGISERSENISHPFANIQNSNQQLQISFSHRDPMVETSRNMTKQLQNTLNKSKKNMIFGGTERKKTDRQLEQLIEESASNSLQSLAQQRQKLLGELFGKLRK